MAKTATLRKGVKHIWVKGCCVRCEKPYTPHNDKTPCGEVLHSMGARSWALEMLIRHDDIEAWVGDELRFPTAKAAEHHGDMLLEKRRHIYARYRTIPSRLPPNIFWLLLGER